MNKCPYLKEPGKLDSKKQRGAAQSVSVCMCVSLCVCVRVRVRVCSSISVSQQSLRLPSPQTKKNNILTQELGPSESQPALSELPSSEMDLCVLESILISCCVSVSKTTGHMMADSKPGLPLWRGEKRLMILPGPLSLNGERSNPLVPWLV